MTTQHKHNGVTWIDLESPTTGEVQEVAEKYLLHPLIVRDLSSPSDRQKVDLYEDYMYLILHFPTFGSARGSRGPEEIDFIVGKNFIITVHYGPSDVLRGFAGSFEVDSLLEKGKHQIHAGFFFFDIIKRFYASLEEQLEAVDEDLQKAKKGIFGHNERAMVARLSFINRTLLDFRIAIKSHGFIWDSFEKAGGVFFDKKFSYYSSAISGGYQKIWNMLEGSKEILTDLRETNDSLLSTRMNETMVHLTMMAFVVFPLTLIAGIFSMQTHETPILGTPSDFWKVVALMVATTFLVFAFFKYRKWL